MSLEESKQSIIDDFSMFDEWLDKYEYIIELGKKLDSFPENKKTDDRLIKGCQSRVWLDWEVKDGKLCFTADSDAIITKGIFSFLEKLGLKENLSPTRANGLESMVETIKRAAKENVR